MPKQSERLAHLKGFYSLLALLEKKNGGRHLLSQCTGKMNWPDKGVYFFMEPGECRSDSGTGARIVRIGTHALTEGSSTKLWTRLSQHRGQKQSGGGNHRGSIFRLIVGTALVSQNGYEMATWGKGNTASREIRNQEHSLEQKVSVRVGAMPFLWLAICDDPGRNSLRGYVERNTIALLSNYGREPLDPPSENWLGKFSDRDRVRRSGLWNSNHVEETHDDNFLQVFEKLLDETG